MKLKHSKSEYASQGQIPSSGIYPFEEHFCFAWAFLVCVSTVQDTVINHRWILQVLHEWNPQEQVQTN